MPSGPRFRVLIGGAMLAAVAACGSGGSKTPSPTSPSSAANAVGLAVALGTPHSGSIKPADVLQLRATTSFADGSNGDCTEAATWTSSNEQIVRINSQRHGEVSALSGGSATITAACGALKSDFAISVLAVTQATAVLPLGHPSALVMGEHVPLSSAVTFADGTSELCTSTGSWASSNPAAVTVGSDGVAVATGAGSATITSTCRLSSSLLSVTVRPGLRIVGLEDEPFVLLVNPRMTIYTYLVDAAGNTGASCQATFTSSDPSVLTVSREGSGGTIYPTSLGEATITAACGANAAATTVRVARYNAVGVVRKPDGSPLAGAVVDAFYYGASFYEWHSRATSGSDGSYILPMDVSPATIQIVASGYETAVIKPTTWTRQPTMTMADTRMLATPGTSPPGTTTPISIFSVSDAVCNTASYAALCAGQLLVKRHSFLVTRSGRLRVEIALESVPADAAVTFALYCGYSSSADLPYEFESNTVRYYQVSASCGSYELRVTNNSTFGRVPYTVSGFMQ